MSDLKQHAAFDGRTVLVTGGMGFIGSNLVQQLVSFGNVRVKVLDALLPHQGANPFNLEPIADRIELHIGDMSQEADVRDLIGGVDYIFNLAGTGGHLDSMLDPLRDLELNCRAQINLLEACRNFNPDVKIVFTSTRQVYGKPLYLPLDEHHRVSPLDVNGVNKIAAEGYHQVYHRVYGLRSVCLRLTNTYGPRQLVHHDRQGFLPWFIRKAIDGETIELFGGGRQKRDMNFVDDVVEAMLLAAASDIGDGDVFNLGGSSAISLEQLANKLIGITGTGKVEVIPFPKERQNIEIGNVYSSCDKIRNLLRWEPRVDLDEGLRRTVEFYKQNRDHYWNRDKSTVLRSIKAA